MTPHVILITGANRGIGLCIAQTLVQKNARDTIIVTARAQASASEAIQKLKEAGAQSALDSIALDVTSDESIHALVSVIQERYGRLDVLINNAGIAAVPSPDFSDYRQVYNAILDTNVTSVGLMTTLLLPLLLKSPAPKVINISSGRASITKLTSGDLPATVNVPYSVSKVALNVMTLEMAKAEPRVTYYLANPGHCKTAFNGYKGKKDPLLGAEVAANLVHGDYKSGFWHNDGGEMEMMPW
ncbi:NAD(P)-binding protein, partial [Aureobasidium melanogenum]